MPGAIHALPSVWPWLFPAAGSPSHRLRRRIIGGGNSGTRCLVSGLHERRTFASAGVGSAVRGLCGVAARMAERRDAGRADGVLAEAAARAGAVGSADRFWAPGDAKPARRECSFFA